LPLVSFKPEAPKGISEEGRGSIVPCGIKGVNLTPAFQCCMVRPRAISPPKTPVPASGGGQPFSHDDTQETS